MKKLYDVVAIRSLTTVIVLAFHAYGMMYWGKFPDMTQASLSHKCYNDYLAGNTKTHFTP